VRRSSEWSARGSRDQVLRRRALRSDLTLHRRPDFTPRKDLKRSESISPWTFSRAPVWVMTSCSANAPNMSHYEQSTAQICARIPGKMPKIQAFSNSKEYRKRGEIFLRDVIFANLVQAFSREKICKKSESISHGFARAPVWAITSWSIHAPKISSHYEQVTAQNMQACLRKCPTAGTPRK